MASPYQPPVDAECPMLESRITLRSNPRTLVPLLLPVILIVTLVAISVLADAWPVLFGIAPVGLIGYRVLRYLLKQFRNRLRLYDDRIELDFMGEDEAVMRWGELDRAGLATSGRRRSMFLYHADEDQLVEFSDEFESFDAILVAVRERISFEEIDLHGFRTVAEYLRAEASVGNGGATAVGDKSTANEPTIDHPSSAQ